LEKNTSRREGNAREANRTKSKEAARIALGKSSQTDGGNALLAKEISTQKKSDLE